MGNNVAWCDTAWMQQALNALCETLDVSGDMKRQMIEFLYETGLWDRETLKYDAALSRFNDCLNPSKPRKFSLVEIWVLMKQFERFQLLNAMAATTGHDLHRIPTAARIEQLLERVAAGVEQIHQAQAELARLGLGTGAPLRLHPAIAERTGVFDMKASF